MNEGYVKLHRKCLKKGWLQNPKLWAFWCWCLMKATHKEMDFIVGHQVISLSPGQFIFGRKAASKDLHQSEQSIRTHLDFCLNLERNITIQTTNKFSIITIVNWETYQGTDGDVNQQNNQPLTNKQPTTNQQLTTNKKNKVLSSFESSKVTLNKEFVLYAKSQGFGDEKIESLFEAFRDYHVSRLSRFADWLAAWRTWVRNEIKFHGGPKKNGWADLAKEYGQ